MRVLYLGHADSGFLGYGLHVDLEMEYLYSISSLQLDDNSCQPNILIDLGYYADRP